jgi:hypothetical protein
MAFGDKDIQRGDNGPDVVELQLRLIGFRGTLWDGNFGTGTELQVMAFQQEVMEMVSPTGVFDADCFEALYQFEADYPVNFASIRCPCGQCSGFGQGRFKNKYRTGMPKIEAYHRREYPGVHKAILYAFRAACFHLENNDFPLPMLTSGYRCWIHNDMKGRQSTNHMGKAIDIDFPTQAGEDKRDDGERCDEARALLVDKAGFQIGWHGNNRKALEPSRIAPTWIHMDVRCYERKYLADKFFVNDEGQL